jgi:multiple sugar transport system permease protein
MMQAIRFGKFTRALMFIIVVLLVLLWLFPLWNILVSSTKSIDGYMTSRPWNFATGENPSLQFIENVQRALEGSQRGNAIQPAFLNSSLYSVIGALLSIACAALAAFALACLPIKGRFFFFILLFSGAIFPLQVYIIPLFSFFQRTNLYDTKIALVLVYIAICIPFCVFLLRNWYLDVPFELLEAAKLDGASEMQIFRLIFVPLSTPPFATLFLFQFTWIWNDYIFGTTFARSSHTRSIMALLAAQQNMYSSLGIPVVLASAIIASLPTLLLVIGFRNIFFKGMAMQFGGSSK